MSCLFNSLARYVNKTPTELRKEITEYLQTNPCLLDDVKADDVIKWTEQKSLESYTQEMFKEQTWGGCIEIKAFCDLYKMNVTVRYRNKTIEIVTKEPTKTVHINYTGGHYFVT